MFQTLKGNIKLSFLIGGSIIWEKVSNPKREYKMVKRLLKAFKPYIVSNPKREYKIGGKHLRLGIYHQIRVFKQPYKQLTKAK